MSEALAQTPQAGRIEGGIDAIVLGANADGLAAAAYLGKAGFKTVLMETGAEIGGLVRAREFAPNMTCVDGEHLIYMLDPAAVEDLDLYRFGVHFAARRLDTSYFFEEGRMTVLGGDLPVAAQGASEDEDAPGFEALIADAFGLAAWLRPAFSDPAAATLETFFASAPADAARRLRRFALAPATDALDDYLPDGPLKTAMLSEAAFRSAAAPDEAFSFMALVRRWAGEAAGLQGAVAYPQGGAVSVVSALRRAVQAAGVEIRAAAPVRSILIERDRAAGVELEGGGQIRAPIVVAAQNARRTFMDLIGPAHIDIDFQRLVTAPAAEIATARLHLALKGVARDEKTKDNMRRRLVYAPAPDALHRAFADARAGKVPEALIIEAVFTSAFDDNAEAGKMQILSIMAHPLPVDESPDDARRREIEDVILRNLNEFAPGVADRFVASDLRLPCDFKAHADSAAAAARPAVIRQWALAGAVRAAGDIGGLYFCGPEAQIGAGLSCSAGRVAAKTAIREAKRGAMAL